MVAHGGAVFYGDAAGLVDKHPQRTLCGEFEINQFIAQTGQCFFENILDFQTCTPDKKQKNGRGAISQKFEKLLNYNVVFIKRKEQDAEMAVVWRAFVG